MSFASHPRWLILCLLIAWPACGAESPPSGGYAYKEIDDIAFVSEGVTIAGSLRLPEKKGPHPAIVIAHGSGRSLRSNLNEMAQHFAGMGIAVLTYDKRGVGDSGGVYEGRNNASTENLTLLAKDVVAGVEYLRTRPDIDGDQIGLWGVSQAGWIIPIAATMADDIKFTILLSGPSVTVGEETTYSSITGNSRIPADLSQQEISRRIRERGPYGFDPMPFLKRMTMPGLWLLGEADESIPIPETVVLFDRLIQADKKDFAYHLFENADHALRVNGRRVADYWRVQDNFLKEKVKIKIP